MYQYSIVVILLSFLLTQASACSCGARSFDENFKSSETVLKGKVLSYYEQLPNQKKLSSSKSVKTIIPESRMAVDVGLILGPGTKGPPYNKRTRIYKIRLLGVFKGCPPSSTVFQLKEVRVADCPNNHFCIGCTYVFHLGHEMDSKTALEKKYYDTSGCSGHKYFPALSKAKRQSLIRRSRKDANKCRVHSKK